MVYLHIENPEVTYYYSDSNKLQNTRCMQSILSLVFGLDDLIPHFQQGKTNFLFNMAASKYSRNHIIAEKYKTV
jgi:hypothetical protein